MKKIISISLLSFISILSATSSYSWGTPNNKIKAGKEEYVCVKYKQTGRNSYKCVKRVWR